MSSVPFVGEIIITPFNFTPTQFAFCEGQLMPLSQNTALFALLGTMYGGNGISTFALPDLRGRVPIHSGQGPGLTYRTQGETGGENTVSLNASHLPSHSHEGEVKVPVGQQPNTQSPVNAYPATFGPSDQIDGVNAELYGDSPNQQTGAVASQLTAAAAGGGMPHNNLQPTIAINYCIALQGIFPPRS